MTAQRYAIAATALALVLVLVTLIVSAPVLVHARRSASLGARSALLTAPAVASISRSAASTGTVAAGPSSSSTDTNLLTEAAYRTIIAVPTAEQLEAAREWASQRQGIVSFAVIDSSGTMYGVHENRQYVSASVVKAMLLVAYLRLHDSLSSTAKSQLTSMIHISDNSAANWAQDAVGNAALYKVAELAGMEDFSVSGRWYRSQLTPADQARFFLNMDSLIPEQHRAFARKLLSSITPAQSWGTAEAGRAAGWKVYFKGGWRGTDLGQLVHQSARLEMEGQTIAIVIMTDGDPSMSYGIETIRGIAARLLAANP